ncbi:ATP-binding protein [bacterium]|nr:ATP-binding protein [bacterium]
MKIAIASGKGGTGKTTVATNLTYMAAENKEQVAYLDCDVEEPNAHIFLKPEIKEQRPVVRLIPVVDEDKCTLCGQCGEICQFSAIVLVGRKVIAYPELCHACGGCKLVCPAKAITEKTREVGKMEIGSSGSIHFIQGLLNIGEAMSPPVIQAVRQAAPEDIPVIIDAPPGTSCPVIESIRGADYVVLVTEPTPFGLHDLQLAIEMVQALGLVFGVVINRADSGDDKVLDYCRNNAIPVLAEIPDDRQIAEVYSKGEMICEALPEYQQLFKLLFQEILQQAGVHVG